MEAASSLSAVSPPEEIDLNELLTHRHMMYISLPEELCPASRPPSPTSDDRITEMRSHVVSLVTLAGGDPTNPKWGYLSRITNLSCTSRRYVGVEPGVRVDDGRKISVGKKFTWELPETEEEWTAYTQRWEAAVIEEAERKKAKSKTASKASLTSKYWNKNTAVDETRPEPEPEPASRPSSKAEVIREKVERWQAQVVTSATPPDVPMSQETVDVSQPSKVDKGKTPEQGEKVQVSLGFRVVKRSSVTSGKGGNSATSKPRASRLGRVPTPQNDGLVPSAPTIAPEAASSNNLEPLPSVPEHNAVAQVAEVPEASFLPPSFPSQLKTSTPLNDRRHKPHPIAPCSPPPSSPLSTKSFDPSRPRHCEAQQQTSSSYPVISPMRKPTKRMRTSNPTLDAVHMEVDLSMVSPSARSPVSKKTRVDTPQQLSTSTSDSVPVPPSTPPLVSSLPTAPVTPMSRGKGLGNAKGIPVPTTPESHALPTLTELLASSRRSRPRPRPPSRKNTPQHRHGAKTYGRMTEDTELPDAAEDGPEPSPTKTYFSSPASGSSGSPRSARHRPRSPVSPLGFSQHPSAFIPRFVSTQRPAAIVNDDPFLDGAQSQSQHAGSGLMRGSSGFFGMGYSSQFDVEGHVEQVSELLERDVDFNGWLRNLSTDDGGGSELDEPSERGTGSAAMAAQI